ncbi:MAG: bifunctional (p)ppGpp synthetase/guanosine-3',5'-bis(diphosphate) 3'-pyrophosphohydrolase [Acetobacterales bacterium]
MPPRVSPATATPTQEELDRPASASRPRPITPADLVERVRSYDPRCDAGAIERAYAYAMRAHQKQVRASGELYFLHPLEVARILTQYRLDTASIVTALLHDVIEDTEYGLEDVEKLFGSEIARLVDGVTKLSQIELQSDRSKQAENFRKLVLATSEDIRVLLVKLADRLHNMRTLHYIEDPEKRRRTARETLEIYAPLSERMGMQDIKQELEDLAFAEINPDARNSIQRRLEFLRQTGADLTGRIIKALRGLLEDNGVHAVISGRDKTLYSIWLKMQRKNIELEQVSDIVAFRVIVDTIEDCYRVLGLVHSTYPLVPGRFKDYISTPKPNGYRSIHTCVIGPEKQRIELQIRTPEMHEIAEKGVAAHWVYKQGDEKVEGAQYRWLRELLDILETAEGPDDFLEHTKLAMFQDQVFCFSPKGDLIALPRGSTPVDFAFAVHSEIGDTCVGAKVNGRLVPLRSMLENGDQVEIVTSKGQTPSPTWEQFVVTGKARARIRRFVRTQQRQQYASLGKSMLQKAVRQVGHRFSEKRLHAVLEPLRQSNVQDLYSAIGEGKITCREVYGLIYPRDERQPQEPVGKVLPLSEARTRRSRDDAVPIRGLIPGMAVHFAGCCHPLPGDRIVGIITTGKGVTIHTIDCETLDSFTEMPERWIDVAWDDRNGEARVGRLKLVLTNAQGALSSMTTVIARNNGNITNLKITGRSADFFDMLVDIEVESVRHLTNIIAALRATPEINWVDRARG